MAKQTTHERLNLLLGAVAPDTGPQPSAAMALAHLAAVYVEPADDIVWLALSVLRAELPVREDIVALRRRFRLEDPAKVLSGLAKHPYRLGGRVIRPHVRVVSDAVVIDVHHTAQTGLATGIQRVVRKTLAEWLTKHELMLVGWSSSYDGMRELSPAERENAAYGTAPEATAPENNELLVPWRSSYVLPELAIENDRTARIAALAEFSGNRALLIGFDCVPLTSAETTGAGMGAAFARNLVAATYFERIATISEAAATEYGGWRTMLVSAGKAGPDVRSVFLPADAAAATEAQLAAAEKYLTVDGLPLVFCVGSHEPRKNHLAVLAAAELLWSDGDEFSLAFVGGNAWGSDEFQSLLETLSAKGRSVIGVSKITDELLWGGYRAARCTIFPSLNEGFGLPVAESLAVGTPVVTSGYGSMLEIAAAGGAVLVDPRSDEDIARGLRSALFEPGVNERLRAEAAQRPIRTWSDYADDLWAYFFPNE